MVYDFERTCDKALENYPLYMRLVECKIDGMQNKDIQQTLQMEFGIKHSVEYISSLWRNKIPKLIAAAAEDEYLNWYFPLNWKLLPLRCEEPQGSSFFALFNLFIFVHFDY